MWPEDGKNDSFNVGFNDLDDDNDKVVKDGNKIVVQKVTWMKKRWWMGSQWE